MFAFIPYSTGRLVCTIAPLFSAGWQQIFINYTHLAPVSTYLGRISNSFIDTGHLILLTQQLLGKVWNSSIDIIQTINVESHQKNNLLLLPDISLITLGYLSSAAFVLSLKFFYSIYSKVRQRRLQNRANGTEPGETVLIMPDHDEIPQQEGEDQIHIQRLIFGKLLLLLDIAADFSKVGILLLLKMLILPIFLGICLDLSTLCLFCATLESRVLFAAHDIFAAILVHWVVGITFMLVVTVSVLQLREVIHPDLLAPFVRPQEPQPDLLGNLLKDRGLIHAKRMLISLSIYLTILAINIWFPARMLSFTSLRDYMPLFRPKFYYILPPQLQIPIECLVFHLSMLSFLEKHKNQIGELQHAWLLRMGRLFGLTDHLMPRTVEKFVNIGFKSESDLSFWSQLTKIQDGTAFIYLNIEKGYDSIRAYPEESIGTSSATGKRVLSTMGSYPILIDSGNESKTEFPNVIGPYRLSQGWNNEMNTSGVYFWKEFRGPPIPRPPDGWDDLGFGGAEVQGRWAWGNERKSKIEECVAVRKLFFPRRLELEALKGPKKVIAILNAFVSTSIKSLLLFTFSWLGLILTVLYTLSGPVALGRWLFSIIHLSETYIHDPAAFALGSIILFPVSWKSMKVISQTDRVMFKIRHVLINIVKTVLKAFRGSTKNVIMMTALFLWLLLLPLSLGLIYDFFLSKLTAFSKTNSDDLIILLFSSWISGITLLHIWAALCYLGVFKVDFWIEIIDDIGADNGREQLDREDELLHVVNFDESKDNGTRNTPKGRSWQGKNGKIGRFFKTIIAVLCYSEWDKVDRTVLLDECCLPLFDAISISLFAPLSLSLLFRMAQLIYMGNLHGEF
jgi:E3 ubiquitin-protein ligase MARCH6